MIDISQAKLNLLETCPPQFEKVYLQQLSLPTNEEEQERLDWGSQFHLLMQQKALNLPLDSLLTLQPELAKSIKGLLENTAEIWQSKSYLLREAEHYRTFKFKDFLFTVVYDLLLLDKEEAQIFDWKSYGQIVPKLKLAKNWQTRLYMYVLAETTKYLPEQISMTYWFVKNPDNLQKITFQYSQEQHQQNNRDLNILLNKLTNYLTDYVNNQIPFPHGDRCQEICPFFRYEENKNQEKIWVDFADIPEINLTDITNN